MGAGNCCSKPCLKAPRFYGGTRTGLLLPMAQHFETLLVLGATACPYRASQKKCSSLPASHGRTASHAA